MDSLLPSNMMCAESLVLKADLIQLSNGETHELDEVRTLYEEARDWGDEEDESDVLFRRRNPFGKLKQEQT